MGFGEMMTYRVLYKKSAVKELAEIPEKFLIKIRAAIEALADDPRPDGCKKLKGEWVGAYRIEVASQYRVVYEIQDDQIIVSIIRIGTRQGVY
jgi:mRNA interferase RelE/StbE